MIDPEKIPSMVRMCGACPKMCRHVCPTFFAWRSDSPTPHGRALLLHQEFKGTRELDERGIEVLYQCLECSHCLTWCNPEIDIAQIVEQSRVRIVKSKLNPAGLNPMVKSITENHNPFDEEHSSRLEWIPSIKNNGSKIGYFSGCTAAYREMEIAKATVQVLEHLDYSIVISEDEWCCGSPLFRTGFVDAGLTSAKHNVEMLNQLECDEVVVTCPGCYRALTKDYPEQGLNLNKPVYHLSMLLANRLEDLPQGFSDDIITYHDPCHLGRHMGVYQEPREVIERVLGSVPIEMERNRENATCCGNGAGVRTLFTDRAKAIGAERIHHAKDVGANTIVTACPFCKNMLSDQSGADMEVIDLPELILKSFDDEKGDM